MVGIPVPVCVGIVWVGLFGQFPLVAQSIPVRIRIGFAVQWIRAEVEFLAILDPILIGVRKTRIGSML